MSNCNCLTIVILRRNHVDYKELISVINNRFMLIRRAEYSLPCCLQKVVCII